ncbi:hypothetical protein [Marinilabilia salmonicolor]|uniref:hypothetical protein n=1 Tax=Marinilabilia salmonicolor TaxID=989 RepID=UPI000299E2C0|nr:hypothetical protein [Marinilabilia salmonicolor]
MQKSLVFLEDLVSKAGSIPYLKDERKFKRLITSFKTFVFKLAAQSISTKEKRQSLSYLLDIISHIMNENDCSEESSANTLNQLKKFILFLEFNYQTLFNYQMNSPRYMAESLREELKNKYTTLQAGLKDKGIPDNLINVALKPIRANFEKQKNIRFYRYFYLSRYHQWLDEYLSINNHFHNAECDLICLLISRNLNTISFQAYLTNYIKTLLDNQPYLHEKSDILHNLKICLSDLPRSTFMMYSKKNPSAKSFFQKAINSRIQYFDKIANNNQSQELREPKKYYSRPRLQTSLKVSHLGILCRLLHEHGHIINATSTELTNSLATLLELKNKEKISAASLRNKFYSPDEKSLREFKSIIKTWDDKINEILYDINYK